MSLNTNRFSPKDESRSISAGSSTSPGREHSDNFNTSFISHITSVRQRTAQACDKCRNRKTKCSGDKPVCKRCTARGLLCEYTNRDARVFRGGTGLRMRHSGIGFKRSSVSSYDLRHDASTSPQSQAAMKQDPFEKTYALTGNIQPYEFYSNPQSSSQYSRGNDHQQGVQRPRSQGRHHPSARLSSLDTVLHPRSHLHIQGYHSQPSSLYNSPIPPSFGLPLYQASSPVPYPTVDQHAPQYQETSSSGDVAAQKQYLIRQLLLYQQQLPRLAQYQPVEQSIFSSPIYEQSPGVSFSPPEQILHQYNRAYESFSELAPIPGMAYGQTPGAEMDDDGSGSSVSSLSSLHFVSFNEYSDNSRARYPQERQSQIAEQYANIEYMYSSESSQSIDNDPSTASLASSRLSAVHSNSRSVSIKKTNKSESKSPSDARRILVKPDGEPMTAVKMMYPTPITPIRDLHLPEEDFVWSYQHL